MPFYFLIFSFCTSSCTSSRTSSTTLRAVASLCTPPKKGMDSLDDSYLLTGYEPKSYDLKETMSSPTLSS